MRPVSVCILPSQALCFSWMCVVAMSAKDVAIAEDGEEIESKDTWASEEEHKCNLKQLKL